MIAGQTRPGAVERGLRLHHLDHFTVPVHDFDVAARFYTEVLGGAVTQGPRGERPGQEWVRGGHMAVQLFNADGHLVLYWQPWGQPAAGQLHPYRAFSVAHPEHLDEIVSRLERFEVPFALVASRAGASNESVRASLHFRDPDLNQVAVVCPAYPFRRAMSVGAVDPALLVYGRTEWQQGRPATDATPGRERPASAVTAERGYGAGAGERLLAGVERFSLPVRELEKSALFFTEVVGAEVLESEGREVDDRPAVRMRACPGVDLTLARSHHGWQPIDTSNPHWAFSIPGADIEGWVEHLAAWGVPSALVFREDYVADPGVPTRVELHFLDPDGNQIELVAWDYPMNTGAFRGHYNPWDLAYRYDRWPPKGAKSGSLE